jgi:hypothetical protein
MLRVQPVQDLGQAVLISVRDATHTGETKGEAIAECVLSLCDLVDQLRHKMWLPLHPPDGEYNAPTSNQLSITYVYKYQFAFNLMKTLPLNLRQNSGETRNSRGNSPITARYESRRNYRTASACSSSSVSTTWWLS